MTFPSLAASSGGSSGGTGEISGKQPLTFCASPSNGPCRSSGLAAETRDLCWNGSAHHRAKTSSRSRRIRGLTGARGRVSQREAAIVAAALHQKCRSEQLACLQSEIQRGLDSGPARELDINHLIRRGRRWLAAAGGPILHDRCVSFPAEMMTY
jgi:hypothetical protein